ncbi:MAG: serine hydrolase domain-containing protein [Eubacteriales bacterium]
MPAKSQPNLKELHVNTERFEILDQLIDRYIEQKYKQFIIIRACRYGEPIYEYCAGVNTKSYGVRQDCITPVFSCTKPVTAVLIMKLQEDGLLDVCDPVISYLPWLGAGKEGILIWHLLTHTSGIIDEDFYNFRKDYCETSIGLKAPGDDAKSEEWDAYRDSVKEKIGLSKESSRREVDNYFLEHFALTKKPREVMSYGMTAFNLLGEIITAVTSKSIDQYASEALFEPLGMLDSHFVVPPDKYDRVIGRKENAMGYPWINSEGCMNNSFAQNGLKTTVVDMCRFCDCVLGKGELDGKIVLSPASIREMSDNHNFDISGVRNTWSLGWNLRGRKKDDAGVLRSEVSLEHGGWAGAKVLCDPMYGLSAAIFTGEWESPKKHCINNIINVIYSSLR